MMLIYKNSSTRRERVDIRPLSAFGSRLAVASRLGSLVSSLRRWIGGYSFDINTPGCS